MIYIYLDDIYIDDMTYLYIYIYKYILLYMHTYIIY